jgi:tRNA pseudouridine38-40 synthase
MPRYRLDIEYDGSSFAGWQRQAGQPSVQEAIETAIAGFCGEDVRIRGAGRTDAGVHARGQVAHLDLSRDWPEDTVQGALNAHLAMAGAAVSILTASRADDDFDARFSATARHYLYLILNRRAPPSLERNRVWHVPRALDHEAMDEAAQAHVGKHDFTTFRSVQCQASSPVRTLERLDIKGEPFDPEVAEAVQHLPGEGGEQVVAEVMRNGYRWKGRLLRPALVKVTD